VPGRISIAVMALRQFAVVGGVLAGWGPAWLLWGITAGVNFLIQARVTTALGMTRQLLYFPLWEIFFTWSAPVQAAFFLARRRVEWKGRRFGQGNPEARIQNSEEQEAGG